MWEVLLNEHTLIVCPTYNERDNIAPLVRRILSCAPKVVVLFVDDRGTDDTAAQIIAQQQHCDNIHLLARTHPQGLAAAYLAGLRWGLQREFAHFVTMDADLSHDPIYLRPLLELLRSCDVAVGSRYVAGGDVKNWNASRRLLSAFGAFYTRTLLKLEVCDPNAGYVAFRRQALEKLDLSRVGSRGYIFQAELKYRAALAGCSIRETPIVFQDRQRGKSKMTLDIALEAAIYTLRLRRYGNR